MAVVRGLLVDSGMSTERTSHRVRQFPTVRQYMSGTPRTISRRSSLATAHHRMRSGGIRHLPVVEKGEVVGVLSVRDLLLLETLPGVNPRETRVQEAMVRDVFTVPPESPLGEVVEAMIERKMGSAVVVEGAHVVGVFTTIDALTALHRLLEEDFA